MNTQESCTILSPNNKTEECAKFIIDDCTKVFALSDVMVVDREYTFGCWIRSDNAGAIIVHGKSCSSATDWQRFYHTFLADEVDLYIAFTEPGTYYIYHAQLEIGNKATDWNPAPEDLDFTNAIEETNSRVHSLQESVATLIVNNDEIRASVEDVEKVINEVTGELEVTQTEIASLKLASDNLTVEIQTIRDGGSDRVTTTTGVFDDSGLMIDKSDSTTKTQVTPDGMTVYRKDAEGGQEEVLEANSEGVDATNLHAKTYLIVGGRSRFENYGNNRTGCFWIGG